MVKFRAAWWWIDRWRKSTAYTDMTLAEQGAYRNLLDELWLRDGLLPLSDRALANISGDAAAWPKLRSAVLSRFDKMEKGYRNETHDEVAAQSERRARNQKRYRDRRKTDNAAGNVTDNKGGNKAASPDQSPSLVSGPGSVSGTERTKKTLTGRRQAKPATADGQLHKACFEAIWQEHQAAFGGLKPSNAGGHWATVIAALITSGATEPSMRVAARSLAERVKTRPQFSSFTPSKFRDQFTALIAEHDGGSVRGNPQTLAAMRRFVERKS